MSSQHNSPNPATKKDLPAGDGPSKEGKSKAQIRAENRERQEKQRAAKAAAAGNKNPGGGNADTGANKKSTESKPKQKQPVAQKPDDSSGRRGAASQAPTIEAASMAADVEDKIRDLRIFSHFGARGHLGQKIKGEIHPSIVRLGLLFAEYKITGANARCISALTAFKSVIADYVTPTNNSLSRHIMTYLSPQISYLTSARPMSVSLGNAIRSLKLQISEIDIDLPEHAAKTELYSRIDQYMQERILAADVAISTFGLAKIHDGDVVLTYARSSVVEKLLVSAHRAGKRFEVIVVDSRPMLEGRNLLRTLAAVGIPCTYCILSALGTVMKDTSIVFLGTHALHSNGALYSRAGTALVAMMAKQHNVPIVLPKTNLLAAKMSSYGGGGGIPFPGGQPQYVNPNAGYAATPQVQYGQPQMGMMPQSMQPAAAQADPYANAKPGTIAYAKSEGPDGIATYTPVIAQETFYQTPSGPTRGIKWVTATSSQASAAGIPSGAITASSAAQLPQTAGMMPPITMAPGGMAHSGMAHSGMVPGGMAPAGLAPAGMHPMGYPPASPGDDYPVMKPGMSQREYEKVVKRWEKDRRAAEKRARKEEKEKGKRDRDRDHDRDRGWDGQDPYEITSNRGGERQRRVSTGAGLGFERARRMSGGAMLRDDDLSRKLESLDMSFSSRRERRMSGGAQAYATSVGGFRSRKNSMSEAGRERDRKLSGEYGQPRPSFYPPAGAGIPGGGGYGAPVPGGYGAGARSMPGSPVRPHSAFPATHPHDDLIHHHGGPSPRPGYYNSRSRHASPSMGSTNLPGGYGGPTYGGARDPASASAYPSYGTERTPYSTTSNLPPTTNDSYALARRPAGGPSNSMYTVSGRELNRAQPFTAFEEFFLVEDLSELMQPQPPPLPAALVPHDVMAEEWDRCMQGLISLTSQALQSSRSSSLDGLIDLVTQWNTTFFLPRGVDISIYKGNSRRSGPAMNVRSTLRSYDESESESESSSSSSSSTSESEDDRYFSSARREQKTAKRAERKARRKERHRRRRARRRQRSVSIRVRAVPIN
ncbi:unnamed protein product [Rhizoctonia solani]|uniref:Translation initiation factor eIF2B subunit delta n=1 Tax=Rhizoctonia solani TaxID=456999 RepID=A0A8H3D654_9AGAM|nr:unnamed protein product [Rhizoctonia solani]